MVAFTAAFPCALACGGAFYVVSRPWAEGFLLTLNTTVVPRTYAVTLSIGLVCILAAIWVCWRKPPAEGATDRPLAPAESP